jgi:hypothetical protein
MTFFCTSKEKNVSLYVKLRLSASLRRFIACRLSRGMGYSPPHTFEKYTAIRLPDTFGFVPGCTGSSWNA